jgi:hypothetical protein
MASWVERDAMRMALLYRDGPEQWNNIKRSIRQAIEDYTRIYSAPGAPDVQYVDCGENTENCIRVRKVPAPNGNDFSYEIIFIPDQMKIKCSLHALEYDLDIQDGQVVIEGPGKKHFSPDEVSESALRPLFERLTRKKPNITL